MPALSLHLRVRLPPNYVHDLRRRHPDFPAPIAELSAGLVWNWPDVEKWAKANGRTIHETGK